MNPLRCFSRLSFFLLTLGSVLLVTACTPLSVYDQQAKRHRPFQGGTLVLHQDMVFPAGRTRIYLQAGSPGPGVNEFQPHCQLEINTLAPVPQRVVADHFTITGISTRSDRMVEARALQLAATAGLSAVGAFFANGDSGESRQMEAYLFHLHSDSQPDVRLLLCGGAFDDPGRARRPSVQEMMAALGKVATLILE